MSTPALPWRGPGPGRPAVPLPPDDMPRRRGTRPLKRWRYVGVFGEEIMVCAGIARIGPAQTSWWAVWDRRTGRLRERTHLRPRGVGLPPGRVEILDDGVAIDLVLTGGSDVEVVSPHGKAYAWTRKRGGATAAGTVVLDRERLTISAGALIDDSAGYHARRTRWRWSAGVGAAENGAAVAWNLVEGIHDDPAVSERALWIDGEAVPVAPVRFAPGLAAIEFAGGERLAFAPEAKRARRDELLLFASDYEQPFGTFAGELPVVGRLEAAWGVMERHAARW